MQNENLKIGIFGGSFDPVHNKHINLAKEALSQFKLDKIIFIPTKNPPHKSSLHASFEDRTIMLKIALCNEKNFEISRIEENREGYSYTYDTLLELNTLYPNSKFYYIIGEDSLNYLDQWYKAKELFKFTNFIVCKRFKNKEDRRKELKKFGAKLYFLETTPIDISSTEIRKELSLTNYSNDIPIQVLEYILEKSLYDTKLLPFYFSSYILKLYNLINIKRFSHSLGVAYTARALSKIYNQDAIKITTAAILHDCAKNLPLKKMQMIADINNLDISKEALNSDLLHSYIGEYIAKSSFGITDKDILSAIRYHTTGNVNMSIFDMIVYLSDKIEPGRAYYPLLDKIRELSSKNIIKAMILCIETTKKYLSKQNKSMHKDTLKLLNKLKKEIKNGR